MKRRIRQEKKNSHIHTLFQKFTDIHRKVSYIICFGEYNIFFYLFVLPFGATFQQHAFYSVPTVDFSVLKSTSGSYSDDRCKSSKFEIHVLGDEGSPPPSHHLAPFDRAKRELKRVRRCIVGEILSDKRFHLAYSPDINLRIHLR